MMSTAGCGPSNRQCSVGKIAVSARGDTGRTQRRRWWVNQCPMTSTDPIRTAGGGGSREKTLRVWRMSQSLVKNSLRTVCYQKPRWGVVIILLVAVKKRPACDSDNNEFVRELNAQSRLRGKPTLCVFFHRLDCSDAQMFWHLCMVSETARPGCRMGSRSLLSIHTTTNPAGMHNSCPSLPPSSPICNPAWLKQGRTCGDALCGASKWRRTMQCSHVIRLERDAVVSIYSV